MFARLFARRRPAVVCHTGISSLVTACGRPGPASEAGLDKGHLASVNWEHVTCPVCRPQVMVDLVTARFA